MTVVEFPKPEVAYWVCRCGCMTHHVRSTGEIECASCETTQIMPGGYYIDLPEGIVREPVPQEPAPFTLGSDEFPAKRFAGRVLSGEFTMVVGIREDGRISTCGPTEEQTIEQRQWLRRRLREAYQVLTRKCRA